MLKASHLNDIKKSYGRVNLSLKVEQDIRPMIRSMDVAAAAPGELMLDAVICCQNPTLNPALLVGAVCRYLPEFAPNHSRIARKEIFDNTQTVFR